MDSVKILNLLELLKNKEILAVPVEVAIYVVHVSRQLTIGTSEHKFSPIRKFFESSLDLGYF